MSTSDSVASDSLASESAPQRVWYLDSSVALRVLLGHSEGAIDWYEQAVDAGQRVVSSHLIALEVARVLRRESLDVKLGQGFVDELILLRVDDALLGEAAAIKPHVKSLDAIHLASAQRIGAQATTVVTHDKNMARAAEELGFTVLDPVA